MAITKAKKKEIVAGLVEKIAAQKAMVFADFSGLNVKDFSDLKKRLRANGAVFKVAKKRWLTLPLSKRMIG